MNKLLEKVLASSADPKELSLTVKGALLAVVPVVALIIRAAGHNIDNQALQDIVDLIGNATIAIGGTISAIAMVYGAVRKIYNSF